MSTKKAGENKIPADAGHFIRSEIEATDLNKSDLTTKKKKKEAKNIVNKWQENAAIKSLI